MIWTDGRDVPKEIPEDRFHGYSAGKWVDDTTLVVHVVGMMPENRVWLDSTGRPISDADGPAHRRHGHVLLAIGDGGLQPANGRWERGQAPVVAFFGIDGNVERRA